MSSLQQVVAVTRVMEETTNNKLEDRGEVVANPENTEDPKDLRRLGKVFQGVVRVEVVEEERDVEGEDAEQVDHVQKSDREKEIKSLPIKN